MQESVHVYTLGIQRTSFISTQEKLFIINMYLSALPKDLHNELAYRLRGRALVEYCRRYPCNQDNFWSRKLLQDYGVTHDQPVTINDYLAFVFGEELDITPMHQNVEEMLLELQAYASRGTPGAIDYLLLYAPEYYAGVPITEQATYDYIWDTYPHLRLYVVLGALAYDKSLIHPPREMDLPARLVADWLTEICDSDDEEFRIKVGKAIVKSR